MEPVSPPVPLTLILILVFVVMRPVKSVRMSLLVVVTPASLATTWMMECASHAVQTAPPALQEANVRLAKLVSSLLAMESVLRAALMNLSMSQPSYAACQTVLAALVHSLKTAQHVQRG
jgi:hypothetical protein